MASARRLARALEQRLIVLERAICVALMGAMCSLLALQVLFRYGIGRPLGWSEELARFALVWLSFLGSALVAADGEHIAVTVFGDRWGRRWRGAILRATNAITAIVVLAILPTTLDMYRATVGVPSPGIGISRAWLFLIAMAGLALILIHTALHALFGVREPPGGTTPGSQGSTDIGV